MSTIGDVQGKLIITHTGDLLGDLLGNDIIEFGSFSGCVKEPV